MTRTIGSLALSALIGILASGGAHAVPVLDQSNLGPPGNAFCAVFSGQNCAQTFTVGITGVMTSVDAYVDVRGTPAGTLVLAIHAVAGGVPSGPPLAGVILDPGSVVGYTSFDISDLNVTAGDQLAIRFLSNVSVAGNDYLAHPITGLGDADLYSGGEFLQGSPGSWADFSPTASFDLIFATYVDPQQSIPEPASLVLIAVSQERPELANHCHIEPCLRTAVMRTKAD